MPTSATGLSAKAVATSPCSRALPIRVPPHRGQSQPVTIRNGQPRPTPVVAYSALSPRPVGEEAHQRAQRRAGTEARPGPDVAGAVDPQVRHAPIVPPGRGPADRTRSSLGRRSDPRPTPTRPRSTVSDQPDARGAAPGSDRARLVQPVLRPRAPLRPARGRAARRTTDRSRTWAHPGPDRPYRWHRSTRDLSTPCVRAPAGRSPRRTTTRAGPAASAPPLLDALPGVVAAVVLVAGYLPTYVGFVRGDLTVAPRYPLLVVGSLLALRRPAPDRREPPRPGGPDRAVRRQATHGDLAGPPDDRPADRHARRLRPRPAARPRRARLRRLPVAAVGRRASDAGRQGRGDRRRPHAGRSRWPRTSVDRLSGSAASSQGWTSTGALTACVGA